jgi:hypothetical protein
LAALGIPSQDEYLRLYVKALGTPRIPSECLWYARHWSDVDHSSAAVVDSNGLPAHFDFYLAFAFFRMASILQVRCVSV